MFYSLGVLALSWYPPVMADENGDPTDGLVPIILDIAHKYKLKVQYLKFVKKNSYNGLNKIVYIVIATKFVDILCPFLSD